MPSTYACLYYHIIFSTKDRLPWIERDLIERLHAYIGGCLNALGSIPIAVGGVSDHVHVLVRSDPTQNISSLMRSVKRESSCWMKENKQDGLFSWQEGYGAFSVSPNTVEDVRNYILNQEEHHRNRSFEEEFQSILRKAGVSSSNIS
ncbi:hypothetical protein Rhal01_02640 [Rubritalea halochordaticola]|uniref:Transposase IS200-like domain-containing protein n=1 Tax=Rubritalea halochordaticola TaxID=714537 RepID=A0ABP9V187_9BACT